MALAQLLVHVLTVERREATKDRFDQPNERWTVLEAGVACRVTRARGSERNTERMRETYDVTHEMFLLPGASNVREDDRVTVKDAANRVVIENARVVLMRNVFASGTEPHHVEVMLDALRGPQGG